LWIDVSGEHLQPSLGEGRSAREPDSPETYDPDCQLALYD